jgi:hypothetical protein
MPIRRAIRKYYENHAKILLALKSSESYHSAVLANTQKDRKDATDEPGFALPFMPAERPTLNSMKSQPREKNC